MYRSFKIFLKRFSSQKLINTLSISGLSIGITVSLVMGWWALNEFSFDKFHEDADITYRVVRKGYINNETIVVASCFAPLSKECSDKFPEIIESVRALKHTGEEFIVNDHKEYESIIFADSNFFDFFSFKIIQSQNPKALNAPKSIVLSQTLANKYFPNEDPIGKIITIRGDAWTVSGLMENIPENSHLQFKAVLNIAGVPSMDNESWGSRDQYITYFKLIDNINLDEFGLKITDLTHEKLPFLKEIPIRHVLQPLKDIHFESNDFRFDSAVSGDKRLVLILVLMSFIILAIACINFTNLFISTSFLRAKSLAIKKTNGATRTSLIREFYIETAVYVIISIILGTVLAFVILPTFNRLSGSNITFDLTNPVFYAFILTIGIFTIFLSGTVPAFSMSKMELIDSLKGKVRGKSISYFQKSLIIIQFTASIVLLISVFTIRKQIHFMQHTDLGFTIENTINIQPLGEFSESYDAYRNELIKSPYILDVSAKNCLPTDWNNGNAVSIPGSDAEPYLMEVCWAKDNYFDMMDIEIIEGDPITLENSKQEYVWLNEQALKVLNLEDPIGKTVLINESPTTIKGIFENVKSKSLHIKVDPQVYQPMYNVYPYYQLFIRTNGDVREALKDIETQWDKAIPGEIFEYTFLDQTYHNLYTAEVRAGKIVTWGMGIALFLTLIGLFAMATYSAERRTKEIGIRKVNGARITEILTLLNKEFLKYILISCVLAIPISWYLMNNWLENFAFRTNLSWWIFGLASVIVMVISIITVTWQSWKSARKNPVEALRYE